MGGLALPPDLAPWAALALLAVTFALFAAERRPPEVIAFGAAAVALALGLAETGDLLAAAANPAPATIAAMFVLSAALVRTGALDAAAAGMTRLARHRPRAALAGFFVAAAAASAVMNNTPVVMALIPIAIALARQIGESPGRILIPLSYSVILGGTLTMVGTSTNLMVDGAAQARGLAPFGFLEILPLGLGVLAAGGAFMALAGRRLLPEREPEGERARVGARSWIAELSVPAGSPLVGRGAAAVDALEHGRARLIDVLRGDVSLRRDLSAVRLEAGDRVVLRAEEAALRGWREGAAKALAAPGLEPGAARRSVLVEALVGPRSRARGMRADDLGWRRAYGVYPLALHREGEDHARPGEVPLVAGDILLLDGAAADIERLAQVQRLTLLSPSGARAFRRGKAPVAVGALAAVIGLSALGVAPILPLALVAAALVLGAGCLDAEEGIEAMDGRLLLLIVSMLTLGTAVERSGALALLIEAARPLLGAGSPLLALALIYAMTSVLTEAVTNNAVAALMTPVAIGAAESLGLDPRPFVVAVMFGASASFATPIGYQTNTLVARAGGYRFVDFLRVGVPMNLIAGAATVLLIPLLWPLE